MYYPESRNILLKIKKAKQILINVHVNPDLDTVGSATALYQVLKKMGKDVALVCPSQLEENFLSLPYADKIKTIDFSKFRFDKFDPFLVLDTGSIDRITGKKGIKIPEIPWIIVDHHKSNKVGGVIRLLDEKASAACEMLYNVINDWRFKIDKNIATDLFAGIAGDTVFFKYAQSSSTFKIATELLKIGADRNKIVLNIFNNLNFNHVKFMGEFLSNMKFNRKGKFVWAALPYGEYIKFGRQRGSREAVADQFFQSVKGTDFGIAMLETEKGKLSVSIRSKKGTDVSKLAEKLGRGGHENAAGATVYNSFDKAVKEVLAAAQSYHSMSTSEVKQLG